MLRQVRRYEAHVLTLWRKSQEAPLELLAAPQVSPVGNEAASACRAHLESPYKVRPEICLVYLWYIPFAEISLVYTTIIDFEKNAVYINSIK